MADRGLSCGVLCDIKPDAFLLSKSSRIRFLSFKTIIDSALDSVAEVIEKQRTQKMLGIRNRSKKGWDAVSSKGEVKKALVDGVIPLKDSISFKAGDEIIRIVEN